MLSLGTFTCCYTSIGEHLISVVGRLWLSHGGHKPTFLQTFSGTMGASAWTLESKVAKRGEARSVIRTDTSS